MRNVLVKEIQSLLDSSDKICGNIENCFNNIQPSDNINEESLDWINPLKSNKLEYARNSKAKVIICDCSLEITEDLINNKCFIIVDNPKLTFIRIANTFFTTKPEYGIHQTAIIDPEASVSKNSYIGPHTYIGKVKIDDYSIIHGNCFIYDNVTIGKNVTIHAGTVIGADGFGYQRNDRGEFEKFPHIGGVIINDNVEIGSNTSIDRGALGYTIIGEGAKIDNLVHIAHNVKVGKHSAVIANTMIGGSTIIGDYAWVAPSVSLRDQISIGNNVTVGMGAVVTKNIPEGETWTGSPAKPLQDFIELQNKFKKL